MRLQFEKEKKKCQVALTSKKQLEKFQIQISPLLWRPQSPQGCLKKQIYPLRSTLVVWCTKIGPKTQNLWKTAENPSFFNVFFCDFLDVLNFIRFGWIVAHQTTKFKLSGQFCFFRHPWGSWGRQSSGLKQELANSVTV